MLSIISLLACLPGPCEENRSLPSLCLQLQSCNTTAKPLLEQIKTAIQVARGDALPKSALAKACNYTLTLWQRLIRFLENPVLELSNNLAENAIRPVALGRSYEQWGIRQSLTRAEGDFL